MSPELSQLLSLQETDLEIKRINEQIASLPARQSQIERDFAESVKEHLDLKRDFEAAQAEKNRLEADLLAEQQKLEKFKADLMKARNEKEYSTAVREIDVAKKAISSFETELLKSMERVEKLSADFQSKSPELEAGRREMDRQRDEITTAVNACQGRLSSLKEERNKLFETLGNTARAIYSRVSRLRGGVVLAEAKDYSCQACRMKIRPQVYNDIRVGETIIMCESCGRVLFYRQTSTPSGDQMI